MTSPEGTKQSAARIFENPSLQDDQIDVSIRRTVLRHRFRNSQQRVRATRKLRGRSTRTGAPLLRSYACLTDSDRRQPPIAGHPRCAGTVPTYSLVAHYRRRRSGE